MPRGQVFEILYEYKQGEIGIGTAYDLIVKEMQKSNGLITKYDLEKYSSVYREPVIGTFRDIEIISRWSNPSF